MDEGVVERLELLINVSEVGLPPADNQLFGVLHVDVDSDGYDGFPLAHITAQEKALKAWRNDYENTTRVAGRRFFEQGMLSQHIDRTGQDVGLLKDFLSEVSGEIEAALARTEDAENLLKSISEQDPRFEPVLGRYQEDRLYLSTLGGLKDKALRVLAAMNVRRDTLLAAQMTHDMAGELFCDDPTVETWGSHIRNYISKRRRKKGEVAELFEAISILLLDEDCTVDNLRAFSASVEIKMHEKYYREYTGRKGSAIETRLRRYFRSMDVKLPENTTEWMKLAQGWRCLPMAFRRSL